jgi:hypothetical protein
MTVERQSPHLSGDCLFYNLIQVSQAQLQGQGARSKGQEITPSAEMILLVSLIFFLIL